MFTTRRGIPGFFRWADSRGGYTVSRRDMDAQNSPRNTKTCYRTPACRRGAALLSLVLPWLSGCVYFGDWLHNGLKVGPDYQGPTALVENEWIDFNNPRIISNSCGVDEAAWWRSFNDPVMDELVLTGAAAESTAAGWPALRVLEAQAQRAIAVGSLFPQSQEVCRQLRTTAAKSRRIHQRPTARDRSLGVWTTGFNASWELDVWGRFRRAIESADATWTPRSSITTTSWSR